MKELKLDNKGFSIVELMLTTALFGMIAIAVTYFLTTGLRTCNTTQRYINLQLESQIVMNQLSNFTQEANNVRFDGDGTDNGDLYILNVDKVTKSVQDSMLISFVKDENKLYYYDLDSSGAPIGDKQLLGEHVSKFKVDVKKSSTMQLVDFDLEFVYEEQSYPNKASVKLRNSYVDVVATASPTPTV